MFAEKIASEKRWQDAGAALCGKYCHVVLKIPLPAVFGGCKLRPLKRLRIGLCTL
jgi:hypothetical protein